MTILSTGSEMEPFLAGNVLSDSEHFSFPDAAHGDVIPRNELLVRLCKGKRVLHLGCADHPGLIERRRAQGDYLHDLLAASCSRLVGADTNDEGLNLMRTMGIADVYAVDEVPDEPWDIVLVPDVIEHVGNVEAFLQSLDQYDANRFIFTTPNAFALSRRKWLRCEAINTDHRYWFSPYTLAKSLYGGGFVVDAFWFTGGATWRHPLRSLLKHRYPLCREGLAVVAKKRTV